MTPAHKTHAQAKAHATCDTCFYNFVYHCRGCATCHAAGGERAKRADLCDGGAQLWDYWKRAEATYRRRFGVRSSSTSG